MANNNIKDIRLELKPPRPQSGTGDLVIQFGNADQQVILNWKNGDLVDVVPHPGNSKTLDMSNLKMEEGNITTCMKCAYDSETKQQVCWPIVC